MLKKILAGAFLFSLAMTASAVPIVIEAQLTGDIRPDNPDNLIVDVTITIDDATPDVASWVIDINSPDHPDIKLDEFYFNLGADASLFSFSGFDPTGWTVSSPATVQGAGGATFMFETLDPPGPPNAADVTNTQNLTFTMTYTGAGDLFDLVETIFTNAPTALSNDAGSGQLGAHLQSLTVNSTTCPQGGCSDSGFAFGDYDVDGGGGPPTEVPEPSVLFLLGSGLLGLWYSRRRYS